MVVTGNIKKIMYMGKEISEVRHTDTIVWQKQTVKPPPGPKACTTCQTAQTCGEACINCQRGCEGIEASES